MASFFLLARIPQSLAWLRDTRMVWKTLCLRSSSVMARAFSGLTPAEIGMTTPEYCVAILTSSAELSPFLGLSGLTGKTINLGLFSELVLDKLISLLLQG